MGYARLKGAVAALAIMGLGSGAMAATVGTISASNNDAIQPLFGASEVEGWFGATLYALGDLVVEFTYWGREAGFTNYFSAIAGAVNFNTGPGGGEVFGTMPNAPLATVSNVNVASGIIDFWFGIDGITDQVVNGSNPAPTDGPGYFATFGMSPDTVINGTTASGGQVVWLFLDDWGAGPDDNHDDMVVRLEVQQGRIGIAPVPLPAGGLLLLGGLAGLVALKRRKAA